MKLEKLTQHCPDFDLDESAFVPTGKKVQGALLSKLDHALLISSPNRYKLFCTGVHRVKILEGAGHFKWARGEKTFSAGEEFFLEDVGEYELNGAGKYLILT